MKSLLKSKRKTAVAYISASLLLLTSVLLGILLGGVKINVSDIFEALFCGNTVTAESKIILYVRLPRVLSGIICGAALAASGAVIQSVLANNLASPSIIGVNSGAGLAVTVCAALGVVGGFGTSIFAFLGALLAVSLVSLGAKRWGASRGTVILMGVAMNSLLGAISDAIVTLVPEVSLMRHDFKIGDLSGATYTKLTYAAAIVIVSLILLFSLTSELDVLTLGDENARGLGLNVAVMRPLFLVLAALLASSAVSIAGLLSFVGLLVPHAVRRISGSSARTLLPLCAIFGAGFVTLCDTLSRVIFSPYEIPVGIIMAFLGAPFFLFILLKRREGTSNART